MAFCGVEMQELQEDLVIVPNSPSARHGRESSSDTTTTVNITPGAPGAPADASPHILQSDSQREVDEVDPCYGFTDEEHALNGFISLHPMLSSSLLGPEVLQQLGAMKIRRPIQLDSLPVIGKSYEDAFLRPPMINVGERPCINDADCLCVHIARLRHGVETPFAFTCTEFLLPEQHSKFISGKGLPAQRNKCLVCLRYYVTFLYLMARADRSFRTSTAAYGMQTHSNQCSDTPPQRGSPSAESSAMPHLEETGGHGSDTDDTSRRIASALKQRSLPLHANTVGVDDGYLPSAMLFADEEYTQSHTMRVTDMGQLMWRPFVKFSSVHFRYVVDEDGRPRIVQCGVGASEHLNGCAPSKTVGWMAPAPPVH